MPTTLATSRRRWGLIGIGVPTVIGLFLVSGVFQWSPLNCWNDYVDINTGRVRRDWFLLYFKVADRTEDTWLSRIRDAHGSSPDWRCVNTFSPFVHYSPHYAYHGAIYQIESIQRSEELVPFAPEARRKVADKLLSIWQNTGSYQDASGYVQDVENMACRLHDNRASVVNASDLPNGSDVRTKR